MKYLIGMSLGLKKLCPCDMLWMALFQYSLVCSCSVIVHLG